MKIRESCLQTGNFIYKPGISLTKQDFHLQRGSLGLQRGFSGYYLPTKSILLMNYSPFVIVIRYLPYDYLIRAKIRENTYHFTNEWAGKPVK